MFVHLPFPEKPWIMTLKQLFPSVNKLRPGDIEIIASLGDSIIGATGGDADNLFHAREQFRGISFASGARVRKTFLDLYKIC